MPTPSLPGDLPTRDNAPLPGPVQALYGPIVGADLRSVRVHTGAQAIASASALGARAYTEGHDITFGVGQYAPHRPDGLRLLAHELTHVAQAERGAPRARRLQPLSGTGGLTTDDIVVRNAPPTASIPASRDPLARFPTIAAALDTESYQRLQRIIARYRPYEPMAEGMRGVTCPVNRLLAPDAWPAPMGTLASEILPYLLNRSTSPTVLALIMQNETLRRFMAANYPEPTATVSVEIQPLIGPPVRPIARGSHRAAQGAPTATGPSVANTGLIFVLKERTFAIGDGLLHLSLLDEAAGGQIASIANNVIGDVDQLATYASYILSGREARKQLPGLAMNITMRPSDFALADVRELQSETASLVSALKDLSGNQAAPELNEEAAELVAGLLPGQAWLETAVGIVDQLHQRTAVGSTTEETADYLQQQSEELDKKGHTLGSLLMADESAKFRVNSGLLNLFTGGAISDLDKSVLQYRAGQISLSAYHSLVRHAAIKAGLAITISIAAGMVGGWAGGLAGRAIFGAGSLGMSMTAGFGGGLVSGVSFVGTQDVYSRATAALSSDPYVQARMRASLHSSTDYLVAGGLGGVLGMGLGGLLHAPTPPSTSALLPGATEPITLLDASGRPIRIAGGQIIEPPVSRGPVLLGPDGQPLNPAGARPAPLFFDASGRPMLPQVPSGATTTLTGQSRLAGPSGSPLGGGPVGGVPPILVDVQGRPLAQSHPGPVIVDLQSGTTSFLDEMLATTPSARGIGVESGRWLLGYQGINPTAQGDLDLALGIARNSPIWPDTPAWRTPLAQTPRLLPWEVDPATALFPASGPITVLPEPFFPATGSSGRLVPLNIHDIPPGGIQPTVHPALHGIADQVYLRRPFGLAFADPAKTQQLGQELNQILKPGGFVEIRLRAQTELSVPAAGAEGTDQAAMIAAQIEDAQVVRVDRGAIQRFQDKGVLPSDPQQAAVLQNAASDIRGLGEGSYARIIRIYKGK